MGFSMFLSFTVFSFVGFYLLLFFVSFFLFFISYVSFFVSLIAISVIIIIIIIIIIIYFLSFILVHVLLLFQCLMFGLLLCLKNHDCSYYF